ncbi:bile acid:sodium symporter family protein [Gordonia sp. VNK21]|uniref:bile acid:sodium symporter family protein n=1 Tax=Gordonia sp. VNK21 TaxID=3382483 RepID=UPI0038D3C472
MDSPEVFANALLASLAFVMFGLGLSLTTADFTRVVRYPVAVIVAMLIQLLILPALCFGLVIAFDLPTLFAVGMMILAAAPGGISANLFSHIFGGNVAMNITVTAVNTVLAIVSIPLIVNFSISYFASNDEVVSLQFGKLTEVISMIIIPVAVGMAAGRRFPRLRVHMERPVKILSAVVLTAVVLTSIAAEWSSVADNFGDLGIPVLLFNLAALSLGYGLSRGVQLNHRDATAICFEVGIHNSTLAIFVAVSVFDDFKVALPTAVYSVIMYITAPLFGTLITRFARPQIASTDTH